MDDSYLKQMVIDLREAENQLRHEVSQYNNPYNHKPEENLKLAQDNVKRLHELIRSYKSGELNKEKSQK